MALQSATAERFTPRIPLLQRLAMACLFGGLRIANVLRLQQTEMNDWIEDHSDDLDEDEPRRSDDR